METTGKLVRDHIPEIIRDDGGTPITRTLDSDEHWPALLAKLREETDELAHADSDNQRLEELADVYEVVRALVNALGREWADLSELADTKRTLRGGFDAFVWLERVD